MKQYVLNRANTVEGRMSGTVSAKEAKLAWKVIQSELAKSEGGSDE